MSKIFKDLERFRRDRGLDANGFDLETYLRKDLEEMFELMGYPDEYCKKAGKQFANRFIVNRNNAIENGIEITNNSFVKVDALGDRIVYAVEAIEQLEFDAEIVMDEVQQEINSREGKVVDGKFEKFKTDEAKAKWYKADFHKAKR